MRRFESVRRPHPLQGDGRLLDGIQRERELLLDLRSTADVVIDSSGLNVHQLSAKLSSLFAGDRRVQLRIAVMSFGFKYGLPLDADVVFDMRFLPNPYWVPELRALTGRDTPVSEFVMRQEGADEFLSRRRQPARHDDRRLRPRGPPLRHGRRRVHGWQAPVRGDRRGAERAAPRTRPRRHLRRPPGPGPGVTGTLSVPTPRPPLGSPHQRRIVALGGGHGLAAALTALRLLTDDVTAVVTVADDGGSSGRLREEFDVLPPGDLRMALAALCDDSDWGHTWRDVLQHRFAGTGDLKGHALGNLMIVSIWELLGDTVQGLDLVGRLLGARGRVLPMAAEPLEIVAEIRGHDPDRPDETVEVRGQHRVASSPGIVSSIGIVPTCPEPCPEALAAVREADWVMLGPGSWFTSVMPHLLVPALADALVTTSARRLLNLNLEVHMGETRDFRAEDHLASFAANAPDVRLDVVLADPSVVPDDASLRAAAAELGAELVVSPVAARGEPGVHDPLRLAAALRDVIS